MGYRRNAGKPWQGALVFVLSLLAAVWAVPTDAATLKSVFPNIKWQEGPSVGPLGTFAEVQVPDGFLFAGAEDTRTLMQAMENPPTGTEVGFLAPAGERWFLVFEFDDVGYVRDDERNALDANAMLEAIRRGTERGNQERQKRGWAPLVIEGWDVPPQYDPTTNNLEWSVRASSMGRAVVNYNTRLLGRRGVMKVTFVSDPATIESRLSDAKGLLGNFTFTDGHRYAQFVRGDKVAQYGLTALVVGGAGVAAVKGGLFKWLWKAIVVVAVGAAAFLRNLCGSRRAA